MDKKKCWCYLTYVFSVDEVPPLPFANTNGQEQPSLPVPPQSVGFEPEWFFRAKFPEDEEV